ncbi:MAG: phenylalanine--tRNA ligase subunit alpha [Anaeroplasmataceae bacterium]
MKEELEKIISDANEQFKNVKDKVELNVLKSNFLGKKGPLASIMANMKSLSPEERKEVGILTNNFKNEVEKLYNDKMTELNEAEINEKLKNETIDVTLPGAKLNVGTIHPLNQVIMELEDLFVGMGYEVCEGPEIETDEYCFEKLNLPKGHPARDMQDTFYINPEVLLRSQTSPVQARTMLEKKGAPIKIICPGKVYRRDADDATHSHQFMQCEGLVLGEDISFANLKGVLLEVARKMFGEKNNIRLRPSFFPFTEPSVEVDVSCSKCGGKGCSMCKNTGWIEVLGAGMVNNKVLEMSGYDSTKIQGFAFGIGIERVAILKNGIDDIRNFYTNDIRFLSQFKEVK